MSNEKSVKIKGFNGPYENKYLGGFAPGTQDQKFKTLEEARNQCLKTKFSTGITYTRNGYYTLRKGKTLLDSDKHNRFKNKEMTWVKDPNYILKRPKLKSKNIFKKENIVIEEVLRKNKYNLEDIYEIILIKNKEYYYNSKNRNILDLEGNNVGELVRGEMNYF